MESLIQFLLKFTEIGNLENDFYKGHDIFRKESNIGDCLCCFLNSRMDETRIWYANQFVSELLIGRNQVHIDFFRKAVLRREITDYVDYQKQRDHAAHTLYNYLLGWVIISINSEVFGAMKEAFDRRFGSAENRDKTLKGFWNLWHLVSILHDIGYLFEGVELPLAISPRQEKVSESIMVLDNFFQSRYWYDIGIANLEERRVLERLSSVSTPSFQVDSLGVLADRLRAVGCLEALKENALDSFNENKMPCPTILTSRDPLPTDAFSLWKEHYKAYNHFNMAGYVDELDKSFKHLIWEGLPKNNLRLIDHGVCSGLLLLLVESLYYRMHHGLRTPSNSLEQKVWNYIKGERGGGRIKYPAHWWWAAMVWATAAVAVHNIMQMDKWPHSRKQMDKLKLEDDPLAYLGILVDIVQEWDRYTTKRESMVTGGLPLDGQDVMIGYDGEVLVVDYRDTDISKKIIDALENSLMDWEKIVRVQPAV